MSERSTYLHHLAPSIINIGFSTFQVESTASDVSDSGGRPRQPKSWSANSPARLARALGCAPAIVVLVLLLGGCGSSSTPSESELAAGVPLKIGYLASLTGFCATFSRQYVQGAELAVELINARGGVLGHKLALIVRDDRATPNVGVARARELVEGDRVKYLAGTCSSAVGRSVARLVANPDHVIYVAGVSDPAMTAGGSEVYAFDTIPTTMVEARAAAAYMRAHPEWKRIAVITENYGYGYQVTNAFRRAMRGSGQTIVSQQYVPAGGKGYKPYIEKLTGARPDAVYSTVIAQDAITLVREGLPQGLFDKVNFLGIMDYATIADMSTPPVGVEGYTNYPSAAIYHTRFSRALQSLGATAANGGAAGDAFDQIQVIAQGIERARSTDPTRVRNTLPRATVQSVQGYLKLPRCNHELATPIAMGKVVGPTHAQPFVHFASPTLVKTNGYIEC